MQIGCAIITHRAKEHLPHCLPPLLQSRLKPRILVVNSSSDDGTLELAQTFQVETVRIPRSEFNHGTTREAARKILGTDIIVMLTPDAYFSDPSMLKLLVEPLLQNQAEASYARQIPHCGAGFFESFPREFNYPDKSHIRTLEDIKKFGIYTFFISNSCAAYSNAVLEKIGGFQPVLLGEDTVAAAAILKNGFRIAYVAEAIVKHSHSYSLKNEFCRNFDIGLARKSYSSLLTCSSSDSKRGMQYSFEMCKRLCVRTQHLLPYAIAHIMAKWLGYFIGKNSLNAPLRFKKFLSSQDYFWK